MIKVQIKYNPYTVKTDIKINGKEPDNKRSPLMYVNNKRLQEWMEPRGKWAGIYKELKDNTGDSSIQIEFTGTFGDFKDLEYAKNKYGSCFTQVDLVHKNKDTAGEIDPYQKMRKIKELYRQLQEGPVEELKAEDIQNNFKLAISSEFRIVIAAPMSSGKSTLINAIIGRDLLPALNQATTAVITEIKVNNQLKDFQVSAYDKDNGIVVEKCKATGELISELNNKKDPDDKEGKKSLIRRIDLEGPVPGLPSDMLNPVFVDTPGGDYALNEEHEEKMDEAINDENNSLILYVFNGTQLGVNASNIILRKIADTMQNSVNGKQSRDRILFVANQMDVFDTAKEPYESVIEGTILQQLASNGIMEPNLLLASAETARLIRMVKNGEELSETEEDNLVYLVKRMNRASRMLPKYASINLADKEGLMREAEKCMAAAEKAENDKEMEKNKFRAAEINSGIPAVELAIKEYLEKYAIAIKIKRVHDAFMSKVIERRMIDNCEAEWSRSEESFQAAKAELLKKRNEYDYTKRMMEFKSKMEGIKFDESSVKKVQAKVISEMNDLSMVKNAKDKVKYDKAMDILKEFNHKIEEIGERVEVDLDNILNNEVRKVCEDIIVEYREYIEELDLEGTFNIGNFNLRETAGFKAFDIAKTEDLLKKDYIRKEKVKAGHHKEKRKGAHGAIARWFGMKSGYIKVDDYKKEKFVKLKELIRNQVTEIQNDFDKEMDMIIKDTNDEVEGLKTTTIEELKGLDKLIEDLLDEIDRILANQQELEKKVKENSDKTRWIKDFVEQVEELMLI